jgi:hypothetical protein
VPERPLRHPRVEVIPAALLHIGVDFINRCVLANIAPRSFPNVSRRCKGVSVSTLKEHSLVPQAVGPRREPLSRLAFDFVWRFLCKGVRPSRRQGPEPPFVLRNYDADAALAGQ